MESLASSNKITKRSGFWGSAVVLLAVTSVFAAKEALIPAIVAGEVAVYVFEPLAWLLVIAATLFSSRYLGEARVRFKGAIVALPFTIGLLQVLVVAASGLLFGYGRNPLSFNPRALLMNALFILVPLVGVEISRAYLFDAVARRYFVAGLACLALLYAFVEVPSASFSAARGPEGVLVLFGTKLLPRVASGFLAGLLAYIGGPLSALAYRVPVEAAFGLSPILPSGHWMALSFVNVVVPVVGLLVVGNAYAGSLPEETELGNDLKKTSGAIGWSLSALACLSIFWLLTGAFGFAPKLIASRSMQPKIAIGDIVFLEQAKPVSVNVGDVIAFRDQGRVTVHRVVEIKRGNGGTSYITKGDANNTTDVDPVRVTQIVGKVAFVVPKLGWLGIAVKNAIVGVFG